jgi:O-antigen ligase
LWTGLGVASRRPVFGHGLGTSREANANFGGGDQPEHNLYLETAQELGLVGLAVFLAYLLSVTRTVTRLRADLRQSGTEERLLLLTDDAVQVWLATTLVFSLAAYGLSGYQWYFMGGLTVVVTRLARDARTRTQPGTAAAALDDVGQRTAVLQARP